MCIIIASVFSFLSISFLLEEKYLNALINGTIAIGFLILMIRNIIAKLNKT